jgi:uncharacterized membrane protein
MGEGGRRARGWTGWVRGLLALSGLAVSAYLTAVHYDAAVPLACSQTGLVNCEQVVTSPESVWFGLPVAAWGLVWFAVMLALSLPRPTAGLLRAATAWSLVGGAAVVYLVYAELVLIGRICLWCTAVHVIVLAIVALQTLAAPPAAG